MQLVAFNILGNNFHTVSVPGSKLLSVAVGHKDAYLVN
jgi:hypothetical protein